MYSCMVEEQKGLNRREVLSASAGIAGFSALGTTGIGKVSATKKGDPLAKTNLSEVILTHEGTPKTPISHNDTVAPYKVDPSNGDTLVHDFVPTSLIDLFAENDAVVKSSTGAWDEQFGTVPTTLYGERNEYAELDGGSELILAEEYTSPSVDVTREGDNLLVTAAGESVTVSSGVETRLELPEQTVTVNKPSGSGGTTTIRPIVVARNFGKQTIRKLTGGN